MSCISRKVPEPAANKEEIDGKSQMRTFESIGGLYLFLFPRSFLLFVLKWSRVEEDVMMDSVQTASTAQPTEELTELGKCLMKHEVSLRRIA